MDDKQIKLSEFPLADFSSIKSEIARRSNFQKAVTASMFAYYAWMFQFSLSNEITLSLVIVTWVISFLGFSFYNREKSEINRLGTMINEKIAKPMGEILSVPPNQVIPSEAREVELSQENRTHTSKHNF